MKKITFALSIILIVFGCKSKLNNEKAEQLIMQKLNYSAENPKIVGLNWQDPAWFIEIQVNANAFGGVGEWSTSFSTPNKSLGSFTTNFANWVIANGYFEKGELKDGTHNTENAYHGTEISLKSTGITEKGKTFFNSNPYSKINMYQGNTPVKRRVYLLQYSKPKVIGVRDMGNDTYEVIYQQDYEYVNTDYVNSLKNYLPVVPQSKESTVTIKKYGEEYRVE
jgi:hypothetical protein